jgi:hypothetical protein
LGRTRPQKYQALSHQQDVIDEKVERLRMFPELYQEETFGRWRGLRRIPVANVLVFYGYWREDNSIHIVGIVPARSKR